MIKQSVIHNPLMHFSISKDGKIGKLMGPALLEFEELLKPTGRSIFNEGFNPDNPEFRVLTSPNLELYLTAPEPHKKYWVLFGFKYVDGESVEVMPIGASTNPYWCLGMLIETYTISTSGAKFISAFNPGSLLLSMN